MSKSAETARMQLALRNIEAAITQSFRGWEGSERGDAFSIALGIVQRERAALAQPASEPDPVARMGEVDDITYAGAEVLPERMVLVPRDEAQALLDDLNARIEQADPRAVPVFAGIVALHDALAAAPNQESGS